MDSPPDLTWADAKQIADQLLLESTDKHLTDIECQVLKGAWDGKSYGAIAQELGYTLEYINSDVGYGLWSKLSTATGEKVTKRSFRGALSRQWARQPKRTADPQGLNTTAPVDKGDTDHQAIEQPRYIDRPPTEQQCFNTMVQPGALIRIKAPRKMGKTWLVDRILDYAKQQQYQVIPINLLRIESTVIADLERFLKYFCTQVTRKLKLENRLSDYWDEELGSNTSCTEYFEEYILPNSDRPIVLALDNVDRLFPHAEVAANVFSLLRAWYEDARILPDWQRLRLIIAHSTDIYPTLNVNRSPFNVGLAVELNEFDAEQLAQMAHQQGVFNHSPDQITLLTDLVGGHPYLFQRALEKLRSTDITLEQLLAIAPTEAGPYTPHLRELLAHLQAHPEIATAMKTVLQSPTPVRIKSEAGFMLHSLGLVRFIGDEVTVRCRLYQHYLNQRLDEF